VRVCRLNKRLSVRAFEKINTSRVLEPYRRGYYVYTAQSGRNWKYCTDAVSAYSKTACGTKYIPICQRRCARLAGTVGIRSDIWCTAVKTGYTKAGTQ